MDAETYVKEIKKASAGMSAKTVRELITDLEKSIQAREQRGKCACRTPCQNPAGHEAADQIMLLELKKVACSES